MRKPLARVFYGSGFSDIKKAYKQMARLYHPDVSPPDRVDENTRRFIIVHEAYETLSNPQTRALYDRDLNDGFGFSFSARISDQETEERGEWRRRWESQLDELRRRDFNRGKKSRQQRTKTEIQIGEKWKF
ncbi:hypothetical protein ACS0TY_025909 [Phlomoides rotata]